MMQASRKATAPVRTLLCHMTIPQPATPSSQRRLPAHFASSSPSTGNRPNAMCDGSANRPLTLSVKYGGGHQP